MDTNVLSAFAPGRPPVSEETSQWFEDNTDRLFLSTVTVAEVAAGVAKLRRRGGGHRADRLSAWLDQLQPLYGARLLPLDFEVARITGEMTDAILAAGHQPGFADTAIAATARAKGLTVLTLNQRHFQPLGVPNLDPFKQIPPA